MKKLQVLLCFIMVLVTPLALVSPAKAAYQVTFSQSCSNTNAANVAAMSQFSVEAEDLGANQVGFTFHNTGPIASSITDVYFDDGALLGIAAINESLGVSFSQWAAPQELPGATNCRFETNEGFSADSDSPHLPQNGVNNTPVLPGEWVTIVFDLQTGRSFADVESQLQTGELRIGIHVQGYDDDGSESFATGPGTAIKLDSFSATASHSKVSLSWTTGTEINNAGFNLYRSSSPEGQRVKVNSGLISAAAGSASGASYSAVDAPGYGTFYYWLEDVSNGGAATLHGPVDVTLAPAFRLPTYRPVLPGS